MVPIDIGENIHPPIQFPIINPMLKRKRDPNHVVADTSTHKYPRRERVKTKTLDSRIGLSCKEYNMKFAKDNSWARKQVLKKKENERLRIEHQKQAREKNKEKKKPTQTSGQQQNKEEEEDWSEEDDHTNVLKSDDDDDDNEKKRNSLQPAALREEEDNEEQTFGLTFGLKDKVKAYIKYKGVTKYSNKFRAQISDDGKKYNLGNFETAREAAEAHDRARIEAQHSISKLNFPDKVPKGYMPKKKKLQPNNKTGYRGVIKMGSNFRADISIDGRSRSLGYFATTKEAAIAYDFAAIQAKRSTSELNFPDMIHSNKMKRKKKTTKKKKVRIIKMKKNKKIRKSSTTTKSNNNSSKTGGRGYASREFPESEKTDGKIRKKSSTTTKILREFPEIRTS